MIPTSWRAAGCAFVAIASIAGLILSIYNYIAPLTGINGSFGAILVCGSTLALLLDGIFLSFVTKRSYRSIWLILGFLGAFGTLAAGYFLHTPALVGLMVVVLIGLCLNMTTAPNTTSVARG